MRYHAEAVCPTCLTENLDVELVNVTNPGTVEAPYRSLTVKVTCNGCRTTAEVTGVHFHNICPHDNTTQKNGERYCDDCELELPTCVHKDGTTVFAGVRTCDSCGSVLHRD